MDSSSKERDKTRDNICAGLQALGIDAQMAERSLPLWGLEGNSIAFFNIPRGAIRWINVRCAVGYGIKYDKYNVFCIDYVAPDPKLELNSPRIRIKSVRKKTFPLFGKVVDLHWKGEDSGKGIIELLKNDTVIKHAIMKSYDVVIRNHINPECWIISTKLMNTIKPPPEELWNCYQAIAKHLLAEWPAQSPRSGWVSVHSLGKVDPSQRSLRLSLGCVGFPLVFICSWVGFWFIEGKDMVGLGWGIIIAGLTIAAGVLWYAKLDLPP